MDPGPLAAHHNKTVTAQDLLHSVVPIIRVTKADLPHLNVTFQVLPSSLLLEPWYHTYSASDIHEI